ncbi:M15 family metallopeptidase [Nocardioides dongkuii]|uniref:M15 family metallopeptidase n=1 Tax=Nocardioides dongkuii TaxID=2760089 RepID=UPI0015FDEC56|nr:M15 family metallopeptidase [Nocardioides dongkuii]
MGLRPALGAAGLTGVLVLAAACGTGGGEPATEASPSTAGGSAAASPSPSPRDPGKGSSGAPAAVPIAEYAVDPPGPRKTPLTYADILVTGAEPISDEMLAAVRALPKVSSAERISLAQVSLENRLVNVAAVQPATYRNFADAGSADTQVVWERVAGGEIAVDPSIEKKLPVDKNGFLRLGSDKDAPQAHVGALAPQIEGAVDAVVNEKWAEELDMTLGNALVVATTGYAPQSVEKPLAKAVGEDRTLLFVDAVARYGLDPGVQQTAVVVGATADAVGTFSYTVLGGGRIAPAPEWVSSHISTEPVPILGMVTCNKLIFPQLRAALQEITDLGLAAKINPEEYAGCYYPRFIAGSTTLSNHSFGTALDMNVPGNGRGTVGEMDRTVVAVFKKWGFAWGGDWNYTDPMHFEMNALVDPR